MTSQAQKSLIDLINLKRYAATLFQSNCKSFLNSIRVDTWLTCPFLIIVDDIFADVILGVHLQDVFVFVGVPSPELHQHEHQQHQHCNSTMQPLNTSTHLKTAVQLPSKRSEMDKYDKSLATQTRCPLGLEKDQRGRHSFQT